MREHVMSEVDTNRDTAISLGEFTAYTQTAEFSNPSNDYVMIDEQIARGELYTAVELQEYRFVFFFQFLLIFLTFKKIQKKSQRTRGHSEQ